MLTRRRGRATGSVDARTTLRCIHEDHPTHTVAHAIVKSAITTHTDIGTRSAGAKDPAARAAAPNALEAHVARLQASIATVAHQERLEYLDRVAMPRDQVFVVDHMYMSLFSTCGWIQRLAVRSRCSCQSIAALVLLAVFAAPTSRRRDRSSWPSSSRIASPPSAWPTSSSSWTACVVKVGTHDELMAVRGQYAELYGIRAAAYR